MHISIHPSPPHQTVMKAPSRVPAVLNPLLEDYLKGMQQTAPGRIDAFYLIGSIALDSFNPRLSDIDFLAVLDRPASQEDFDHIQAVHQAVQAKHPQWTLEGIYLQMGDLGCQDHDVTPYLSYYKGNLRRRQELVLSSVTWWILKHRAITLKGTPAGQLPLQVDMDLLLKTQMENMNSYWASFTTRFDGLITLFSDWGVEWTVLGILRQFYTLCEHAIVSKTQAGEYGLSALPEHWHPVIREAIALRDHPERTVYRSRLLRAFAAYRLLKYILRTCSRVYGHLA